jgi:hypothetical protein
MTFDMAIKKKMTSEMIIDKLKNRLEDLKYASYNAGSDNNDFIDGYVSATDNEKFFLEELIEELKPVSDK